MTLKNLTFFASALLLTGSMLSTPAMANNDNGFAALQGVEVQALSPQEMAAITGELNAYNIAAALLDTATALTLAGKTRLAAAATSLANYYLNNATAINLVLARFHILTPCTSGCPAPI